MSPRSGACPRLWPQDAARGDHLARGQWTAPDQKAGLQPIRMYNLRHSFGTTLARGGVDVRTIQAFMRRARLTMTEQYMAYRPQPELANQITRVLDPRSLPEDVTPTPPRLADAGADLLQRLEEEIPARRLREVQRLCAETGA